MRWLLLSLIPYLTSHAQPADNVIKELKDSLKVENANHKQLYYYIANEYRQRGSFDSALLYFHKSLNAYKKLKNQAGVAAIRNSLGKFYYKTGNTDSSIYYYQNALNFYLEESDTFRLASTQLNLGIVYKEVGMYNFALEHLLDAARVLEKQKSSSKLASCYNAIANLHSRQGNFEKSIQFHKKALLIRKQEDSDREVASSLNNLGILYRRLGDYDMALHYLHKSLSIKEKLENPALITSTLNNIGAVLLDQGKHSDAKAYFEKALSIRPAHIDQVGRAITLNNLGRVHVNLGDYRQALLFLDSSYVIIEKEGLLSEMIDNMTFRIKAEQALGNAKLALLHSEQLLKLKDSLLNQEKLESLVEMQAKYESEKKEQSIQSLQIERELQNTEIQLNRLWITILAIGVILVVVIGLFIYSRFRLESRNKRQIETLMQELHHRVKNNLQLLSSIFSLQSKVITDSGALEAVKSSENRVNAMAIIHQKLYAKTENRNIDIQGYFSDLLEQLADSYGYDINSDNFSIEIDKVAIDLDKVISLGLIVNEVVSNSFKYTFSSVNDPQLDIRVKRQDIHLAIEIKDNGKGFDYKAPRKSMGLNIIETLGRQLKATVNWQTSDGVVFSLKMNLI